MGGVYKYLSSCGSTKKSTRDSEHEAHIPSMLLAGGIQNTHFLIFLIGITISVYDMAMNNVFENS